MPGGSTGYDIAVVGMACRFPGARSPAEFWRNLRAGVESVTFFTDDELRAAGESAENLRDPAYVKAQPVLENFDRFDASFFGFSPQDAAVMDPQHRQFLEVGWEALEDAAHEPESFAGNIGVFATCGMNTYMMYNLINNQRIMDTVGEWLVRHTGNDMNFLATRLSYELNLKGPSMNVQTACSSALVAIHQASLSLLSSECDMALAGGSTIVLPHKRGYLYRPNEILAPDGHCRPFDAKARGTLFGSGVGVVVLRRLADALADRDRILAIVKGSAINNDGSAKIGYLAPSVEGQSRAIIEALTISGVQPETITHVEAHGTGTMIGDPIEVVALTGAYRQFTQKKRYCALGSVKSSIGHLGEAAGVAAFIKTVLALENREIPPSLHFESPNPQIDFENSPFIVNAKLTPWPSSVEPRRAGITSLGAGGTNCHVIVEEPPKAQPSGPSRSWQLLLLSADTVPGLERATDNLAQHLKVHPSLNVANVAYTLHCGRKAFTHRRALVCRGNEEAVLACESKQGVITSSGKAATRSVAFLFPGQGAQFPHMGKGLYDSEPVFRAEVDRCVEILRQSSGVDLRDVVFPNSPTDEAQRQLNQTAVAQPALFLVEYALAMLWKSWGVEPRAMLGHSIGEYVAACIAGVFSLPDALALVAERGRLMQQAPKGVMLAVPLCSMEVEELLARREEKSGLSLAVVNGPKQCVVAGPEAIVAAFEAALLASGVQGKRLETSHAFHSAMMDPILTAYAERVRGIQLKPPRIPYLSNLTGTWIRAEEVTDPDYWVRHLRGTVRFSECLATLLADTDQVLLEVGPGHTLGGLVRQQQTQPHGIVYSLGRTREAGHDLEMLLRAYGHLWVLGCKADAGLFYKGQQRQRVQLPTYPFAQERYWIEPDSPAKVVAAGPPTVETSGKRRNLEDWFYLPVWKRSMPPCPAKAPPQADSACLVFLDDSGLGLDLIEQLRNPRSAETNPAAIRLEIGSPGDIDSLSICSFDRQEPGAGEVEIRIDATALNFADVLKASDVFPEAPFGMECAGRIERVGPGVKDLRPGDEVVAIGPESFRSYVNRSTRFVALKPAKLSMEEATTIPAAFMTAWYAIHHIGKMQAKERILIHAASGGVGLAAVQAARRVGAEVFATAGNKEKRSYLESLGIRHVFDSRSTAFADEILARTRGEGVNAVLNSLTGEFIPKSFSVLANGGRFLEIGKREIYTPAQLAALPLRANVSYHPIDLTRLLRDDPEAYGALLGEVVELARNGSFQALPRHVFTFADAPSAFRLMLQTRHIGKVVLSLAPPQPEVYCVRVGPRFQQKSKNEFTVNPGCAADYVALLEALEAGNSRIGRIVHLLSVSRGKKNDGSLEQILERGFFSVTWLAKAVGARDWTQPISLTVVSTDLGAAADDAGAQATKATLLGPCRVIPREFANITCQRISVPATPPDSWHRRRLVRQLLAEMHAVQQEPVVKIDHAGRWIERLESVSLRPSSEGGSLRQSGVYLITGGLGDLGLELAEHLALNFKAKLILISRAFPSARSEWDNWLQSHEEHDPISRTIRRLRTWEAAGAAVTVASADVTDRGRMRAVISAARKQFGVIHGVIHAAGTLDDGLIQLKTQESALGVLAPKVKGALILDELLGDESLDFFVMFSSVSSILGLQGQVDYTAANAFLDAFAEVRSERRAGQTVAINWSAWREVGMAARAAGQARRLLNSDTRRPLHPWLERRQNNGAGIVFTTEFSRKRHWLLDEHSVRGGTAVIPGTGYLELVRAAVAEIAKDCAVELSRVVFQAPFAVANGEAKELTLTLQPAESAWDFSIQSRSGSVTHVTGRAGAVSEPAPRKVDLRAVSAACHARTEAVNGFISQSFMDFGPRWGNVGQIQFGETEALLVLELPSDYAAELGTITLHPALLDMATGGAQALIPAFDAARDFYVPFSYGRLTHWKGLPRRIYSHVKLRDAKSSSLAVFDITIADPEGTVVAEISEFAMKRVSAFATEESLKDHSGQPVLPSPTSLASEILRTGIEPKEGIEALERILAHGVAPQVVVSPVDPYHWIQQAGLSTVDLPRVGAVPAAETKGFRGAPRVSRGLAGDSIEQRLKELYGQILGTKEIGLHDDFFELGGHSLLAVRLLTRIEKEFKKAISLAELFQSSTIASVAKALHGTDGPKSREQSVIIPFNEHGQGPPLYCVHGLGFEVVSFRHLARILGPHQRFYGIQPPPELINADFASSIRAMASYYVDVLMEYQPVGPMVLCGWSAGSTIALEMAQQLRSNGRIVDLLVALDGAPFNTNTGTRAWNPIYWWKLVRNFPYWVADDLLLDFSFVRLWARIKSKFAALFNVGTAKLRGKGNVPFEVGSFMDTSNYSSGQTGFMNGLFNALLAYTPQPYDGPVLVFKSRTQPLYHLLEVERSWAKIASDIEVVVVPGTHVSIVREPFIQPVAEKLRERLSELLPADTLPTGDGPAVSAEVQKT